LDKRDHQCHKSSLLSCVHIMQVVSTTSILIKSL
jgi:hypothetical protein